MVEGRRKSRTLRGVHVRTPSGKSVIHYRDRKTKPAVCASCKKVLKGKKPSRPYGGNLCSACMRKTLVKKV